MPRTEREQLLKLPLAALKSGLADGGFRRVFVVLTNVIKDRGFQSTETEVKRIALHFDRAEFDRRRLGTSGGRQTIKDRAAWIAKTKKFGNLVISFARGVVASLPDFPVAELGRSLGASSLLCSNFVKYGVAARDDKADGGKFGNGAGFVRFQKNGVDMSFEMVDGNQRLVQRKSERLAISDPDQE